MTDPAFCLRNTSVAIGVWSIFYSLIQCGIMGWQVQIVKERRWEYDNRQLPATGAIDGRQNRFPGLYIIYEDTPEKRRTNAMYALVLICVSLAILNFFASISLLYGAIKYKHHFIWPWVAVSSCTTIFSTAYAVLWWSGDVFNEQLTMSVAEFVLSLGINGIAIIIVVFFGFRLVGMLSSDKPSDFEEEYRRDHRGRRRSSSRNRHHHHRHHHTRSGREIYADRPPEDLPPWRKEWAPIEDPQLQRKIRRQRSRRRSGPPGNEVRPTNKLDFFAPETYDNEFPWKLKKMAKEAQEKKPSQQQIIERLYYEEYPDEVPGISTGQRRHLREQRARSSDPNLQIQSVI